MRLGSRMNFPKPLDKVTLFLVVALLYMIGLHAEDADESSADSTIKGMANCDLSEYELPPRSDDEDLNQIAKAVTQFLQSVPTDEMSTTSYCVGDTEMYSWTNVPGRRPGGIRLGNLGEVSQKRAWMALQSLLSQDGFAKVELLATDIELASGAGTVSDYTVAVFGNPMIDSAWGFQFDGHHIALNFLVHGNDLILAPMFLGSQPLTINGKTPLQTEIQLGRQLFDALTSEEKEIATVQGLVRRDVVAGSGSGHIDQNRALDLSIFENVGLPLGDLSETQLELSKQLVGEYLFYLSQPFADRVWSWVEANLANGLFTYSQLEDRVYYRIYVPDTLLIEYDDVASDHIHTVTRLLDKQGRNDYGPFASNPSSKAALVLSDHYRSSPHHNPQAAK
ncbi:MAG: DUF3500 domain-containing protein [Gammaproteobacteria bacterium]|nr:DUF3500 domain-containing protein [Gammaproteobacteria bacterium]MYD80783.1 DUF3500 domain-containing protein [Gammaproteobacteria bacterium]